MPSSVAGVHSNILEVIGGTPMVRINRMNPNPKCEIFAKIEFLNPGGSIKDRIAYRMIRHAEATGRIKPGDTLVEPTSGNTGIGLALCGAVLGYKVIIVMPEKMSMEKQTIMEALGAQIIRTETAAGHDSPNSNFAVARRLAAYLPDAHVLDQFANAENPHVHAETTAEEILEQTEGRLDYFVAGSGTGGTLTGCAQRLKQANPNIKIIGVDPIGSLMGGGTESSPYQVEGIGYDFIPETLHMDLIDRWEKVGDAEAFDLAMRLMREEGLLVGGSCGSAMAGAIRVANDCPDGSRIVVVLTDSVRNYTTKFVNDAWMQNYGFTPYPKNKYVDWDAIKNDV